MTRQFFKDHIEVDRLVTSESDAFARAMMADESIPEIIEDPLVKYAIHWVLSTSTLFSKRLCEYGWGEVWHFCVSLYFHFHLFCTMFLCR